MDKIPTRDPTPEPATTKPEIAKEPATEPTKATTGQKKPRRKISSLKLSEKFLNEIKNKGKKINKQIFNKFCYYHYLLFLVKDLYENNQNK